ncbi:hypothetical protein SFRURICE_000589 [Spodoptera frugiperda]|nr:hypothetical protein SFRURICE_000589 [Spodoptera frugiperda]
MEDEFMSKKNVGRGIFYVFEWRLLGDKSLWDDLGATGRRYEDFMSTLRCVIKFGRDTDATLQLTYTRTNSSPKISLEMAFQIRTTLYNYTNLVLLGNTIYDGPLFLREENPPMDSLNFGEARRNSYFLNRHPGKPARQASAPDMSDYDPDVYKYD